MKQQIKAVLDDERGVSPVIGVILMVAITVILAAVIGTFVLGLGDSLNQAPQATLDAEATSSTELTISHNGGDPIPTSDIRVTIEGATNTPFTESDFTLSGDADGELNVGDTITISHDASDSTQVQVIHTPSQSILLNVELDF